MNINNPFFKTIFHLLGVNGISQIVLLLISIIIFRTVDKSLYGLYVIMFSLFAIVDLLMAGFNECIVRFLKDKISINDKKSIIFFILCYKYSLIAIFILCILVAKIYGFFEYLIGNYDEVSSVLDNFLIVVILNGVFSTLIDVNSSILNSQKQYKLTANLGLCRNISYFLAVIALCFHTNDYLHYLYSSIAISFLLLLFLSIRIFRDCREFSIPSIIKSKFRTEIGRKYIFPYAAPLTASSLLTYVKNYLPIMILGKEFSLENVAIFSIVKTFFKALHSFSGSFIDPMMSKFLELKRNVKSFSENIQYIFWGTLFFRLIIFSSLALILDFIFMIYKIANNEVNQFIFYVLGIEFIIAGMILIYGMILRLDKTTNKVLNASLIRFGIELSLIYFILLDYGIVAAAIILLIARYIETLVTFIYIRNQRFFKYSEMLLLCFSIIIVYLFYKMQVIF